MTVQSCVFFKIVQQYIRCYEVVADYMQIYIIHIEIVHSYKVWRNHAICRNMNRTERYYVKCSQVRKR